MLLKALDEVAQAPNAMMAAEMAIIRLTHVADLPTPSDLIRKLQNTPPGPSAGAPASPPSGSGGPARAERAVLEIVAGDPVAMQATEPEPVAALARFATFDDVVALIRRNRDIRLLVEVEAGVKLVQYTPGRIEFEPAPNAPRDLAGRLSRALMTWTGARWAVSVVSTGGAPTIKDLRDSEDADKLAEAEAHPLVQAALSAFPGAKVTEVRTPDAFEVAPDPDLMEDTEDDDWDPLDPFEEDR